MTETVTSSRCGEWKEINRHRNSIPDGIIPQAAADKVNELYPDSFITKAEYDDGELELKLDNGFELKFDKNFNLQCSIFTVPLPLWRV